MRKWVICGAIALATMVRAEPAGPTATLDLPLEGANTNPDWKAKPSGDQVDAAFPKIAQTLRLNGRAELQCTAEPDGSVDQCAAVNETPTGMGFGAAAVSLAPYFEMRPATMDGRPVAAKINIPINFRMDRDATPRPGPLLPPTEVDPARLALAREILDLQKSAERIRHSWGQWIDGIAAAEVGAGETRPSMEVVDAMQISADQTTTAMIDRAAHTLAEAGTLDELHSARDFLLSPSGRMLVSVEASDEFNMADQWSERMTWTARDAFCAKVKCLEPAAN